MDRRAFLKVAAGLGAGLALGTRGSKGADAARRQSGESVVGLKAPAMQTVRVGFVGVGNRGTGLLGLVLKLEGVQVKAVCDIVPAKADRAAAMVEKAGQERAAEYTNGPTDYKRLCDRNDIDLVYIATPWDWHTPMAVDGMDRGKHVAVEVPAAITLEECWRLVDTAERTQKHCMMLENCCYGETELMVLNMVRQGVFGELTHGEAAYIHEMRDRKLRDDDWRRRFSMERNANLYPTHGLGPVAQYMGINRGDRFDYLVSMSSAAIGLKARAIAKLGPDHPLAKQDYKLGDMNTSIIRTARGRTIMLQHDTTSPRPYCRINLISGTLGTFCGYPDRIALSPKSDEWSTTEEYAKQYMHPLWKKVGELAKKAGGHGGMDFVMNYRLIDCLHNGQALDMDVYDAAAWSCIVELSERSVANRSSPVDVPDFTRGKWKTTPPLGIVA